MTSVDKESDSWIIREMAARPLRLITMYSIIEKRELYIDLSRSNFLNEKVLRHRMKRNETHHLLY